MKTFQLERSWLKKEAPPYTGKLLLTNCHAISLLLLVNHVDMNLKFVLLMDLIFLTTLFLGHRINFSCFLKTNIVVNHRSLKEKKIIINYLKLSILRYASLSQTIFSYLMVVSKSMTVSYSR